MPRHFKKQAKTTSDAEQTPARELGFNVDELEIECKGTIRARRKSKAEAYASAPVQSEFSSSWEFQTAQTKYNVDQSIALGVRMDPCVVCSLKNKSWKIGI